MPGKSPSWPLDLQPGTLPLLHSLSSVTWTCFKVWESCLLIKDLALQRSIIIYVDTRLSLGSCSCSDLPTCGTFLLWLWMHVLPQDLPAASPPGNCPWLPRLVWVPFFRPRHTWTQLCRSTQVQYSYFLRTQSLHWCWAKPASWIQLASSPYAASCPCLYSP